MRMSQRHAVPSPGFGEPVFDSQATFRAILDAMAHPGRILSLPVRPSPVGSLGSAAVATALTLADGDTRIWLDPVARTEAVADYLTFHCGCPFVVRPEEATFAFVAAPGDCMPLWSFNLGTPEYPDRSSTVVFQVDDLRTPAPGSAAYSVRLTGPGIETETRLAVGPLSEGFWDQAKANHSFFPLGVDILFVCDDRIAALPRSTSIEV